MFRNEFDAQLVQALGQGLDSFETDPGVVGWEDRDLFGDCAFQGVDALNETVDGSLNLGLGDLVQS